MCHGTWVEVRGQSSVRSLGPRNQTKILKSWQQMLYSAESSLRLLNCLDMKSFWACLVPSGYNAVLYNRWLTQQTPYSPGG